MYYLCYFTYFPIVYLQHLGLWLLLTVFLRNTMVGIAAAVGIKGVKPIVTR